MTTYERAAQIIAETLPSCRGLPLDRAAAHILRALLDKRIMPQPMRASPELFKRFHAHCSHLGKTDGNGYRYWYNQAIAYAESVDEWPVKIIPRTVTIAGEDITVDVAVPESTTRATNAQLLAAYQVITDAAAEQGIVLPEHEEETPND